MAPRQEKTARGLALSDGDKLVVDAIGRLIEFWGFRRHMGRLWATLYLSDDPLTADDLKTLLAMSAGAVSMTVKELDRWGVVRKVRVEGDRRDFFEPERSVWKMIARVLGQRERVVVVETIEALEDAIAFYKSQRDEPRARGANETKESVERKAHRVKQLLEFAKLGRAMLDAVVQHGKVDVSPLAAFFPRGRIKA